MAQTHVSLLDERWDDPQFQGTAAALNKALRPVAEPEFTVEELRLIGRNIERQVRRHG